MALVIKTTALHMDPLRHGTAPCWTVRHAEKPGGGVTINQPQPGEGSIPSVPVNTNTVPKYATRKDRNMQGHNFNR